MARSIDSAVSERLPESAKWKKCYVAGIDFKSEKYNRLHGAIKYANLDDLNTILKEDICLRLKDEDGRSPALMAIYNRTPDILHAIIAKDPELLSITDKKGNTLLHEAVHLAYHNAKSVGYQYIDIIRTLLELGADKNAKNHKGVSPYSYLSEHKANWIIDSLVIFDDHLTSASSRATITGEATAAGGGGIGGGSIGGGSVAAPSDLTSSGSALEAISELSTAVTGDSFFSAIPASKLRPPHGSITRGRVDTSSVTASKPAKDIGPSGKPENHSHRSLSGHLEYRVLKPRNPNIPGR